MRLLLVFAIAQTVANAVSKAMQDGKITLKEVVDIARDTIEAAGIGELVIYPVSGSKKGKKMKGGTKNGV